MIFLTLLNKVFVPNNLNFYELSKIRIKIKEMFEN